MYAYLIGVSAAILLCAGCALLSDRIALAVGGAVLLTGIGLFVSEIRMGFDFSDDFPLLIVLTLCLSMRPLLISGIARWYRSSGEPEPSAWVWLFLTAYSTVNILLSGNPLTDGFVHFIYGTPDVLVTPLAFAPLFGFVFCRNSALHRALAEGLAAALAAYLPQLVNLLIFDNANGIFAEMLGYIGIFSGIFWILAIGSYLLRRLILTLRRCS